MLNEFREPFEPHLQYLSRKGGAEITRLRVACLSLFLLPGGAGRCGAGVPLRSALAERHLALRYFYVDCDKIIYNSYIKLYMSF